MGLDCKTQIHENTASRFACGGGVGTAFGFQRHVLTETEVYLGVAVVSKEWEPVSSEDGGKELGCRMCRDSGSFGSVQRFEESLCRRGNLWSFSQTQ